MMDDEHGDAKSTLELPQIGEQRRDLAAGVLVDAVQAHEGVEPAYGQRLLRKIEGFKRQAASDVPRSVLEKKCPTRTPTRLRNVMYRRSGAAWAQRA